MTQDTFGLKPLRSMGQSNAVLHANPAAARQVVANVLDDKE